MVVFYWKDSHFITFGDKLTSICNATILNAYMGMTMLNVGEISVMK